MNVLRDARTRGLAVQILLIATVLGAAALLAVTAAANLRARGIPLGFAFLWSASGMPIGESFIAYTLESTYARALLVGLVNTLVVSAIVIVLASVVGLFLGIARLSSNPAVSALARLWVEVARNTPLVVILLFLYGLFAALPDARDAWQPLPGVFLSQRGMMVPRLSLDLPPWAGPAALAVLLLPLVAAAAARRVQARTGRRPPLVLLSVGAAIAGLAGATAIGGFGAAVEWPEFRRFNFVGGREVSPEFTTLVAGLVLYTAGFVGEIVRGGILAIPRGQWEASFALGLRRAQALRLVIVPLALRVIVPPLNSQYINVVKNSTLAIAVGYQEFFTIMGTTINRTSHAIEGIALILGAYLAINLTLSAALNAYNRRVALVER